MKYLVLLCDGMADHPVPLFDGKTPMMVADKKNMNKIASESIIGLAKTVPDQIVPPGSDSANMSVMGYDPLVYYTGRSPIEAVSMGVEMSPTDVAMRCNLVTLSPGCVFYHKHMVDYSAGEITTAEAHELITALAEKLNTEELSFFPGISYRHCLRWKDGSTDFTCTPPHDISGKEIGEYLPGGTYGQKLLELMQKSYDILKDHPVNKARIARKLNPANCIWLWGQGKKPVFPSFAEKYGKKAAVISAVDLVKGLGILAGMDSISVEGATGNITTNFKGKGEAMLDCFEHGYDFVYVHVEAPDECGHQGDAPGKKRAIELIDENILGPALEYASSHDMRIMIMPDHPTPLDIRTHNHEPVPFMLWDSTKPEAGGIFDELGAKASGLYVDPGYRLIDRLLQV